MNAHIQIAADPSFPETRRALFEDRQQRARWQVEEELGYEPVRYRSPCGNGALVTRNGRVLTADEEAADIARDYASDRECRAWHRRLAEVMAEMREAVS